MAKRALVVDDDDTVSEHVTKLLRTRGFEVLLRSSETTNLALELNAFAGSAAKSGILPVEGRNFHRLGPDMTLPKTIDENCRYDVTMIAAPIFDRNGACTFNLCLGPFPGMLTGTEVLGYADRLLRACVTVMQSDRATA